MNGLDFLADAVDSLNDNELSGRSILNLSIDAVLTDPENPRKEYSEKYIEELAASIDSMGVIQPIVVREIPGDEKNYYCNVGSNRVMAVKWLKENKPELLLVFLSIMLSGQKNTQELPHFNVTGILFMP